MDLDHVGYMVADLERATRWLEDVLSAVRVGPIVSIPGTEIRVGAVLLGDFEWEIVEHPQAREGACPVADDALGAHHLVLEASDLTYARSHLSAQGVVSYRNGSSLRFCDPDGFAYRASASHPTGKGSRLRVPGVFDGGVLSLGFNVRSLARSQEWYERSLGLVALPQTARRSVALSAGQVMLRLRETDAAAATGPMTGMGPAHPAIEVEELEETREHLERDGATFLIPPRRDDHEGSRRFGRSSFFVADPDGLPVQVIEPRR